MRSIRPYRPGDLEYVVEIFRSNIPKYFGASEEPGLRDFLREQAENYYVIGDDNANIVGSGGIALNGDETVSLCWGMIHSQLIGTGLGKMLTQFRIEKSRELFGRRPPVISTSQHTRGFYEKFGFIVTRHESNGFGPGIDICEMRLDLE